MKTLLAIALVLPMMIMSGCGDGGTAALDKPGVDPPVEQQKNWQEESRKRSGTLKNVKPPKVDEKKAEAK